MNSQVIAVATELIVLYGILSIAWLVLQTFAAWRYRRTAFPPPRDVEQSVSVIVPVFNEPIERLRACLISILGQDRVNLRDIFVVDDGSTSGNISELMAELVDHPRASVLRFERFDQNRGKRRALAHGFRHSDAEFVVTVDSDTILESATTIQLLLQGFARPNIGAVTGQVKVMNEQKNLLTRLISLRYWNAFHVERAAQSLSRKMLCCSGPLSAYRRELLDEQTVELFVSQTFLGTESRIGDDRHLTNLVLAQGYETLCVVAAQCYTYVPTHLKDYLRQQLRWNRSFYRELIWTAVNVDGLSLFSGFSLMMQGALPLLLVVAVANVLYQALSGHLLVALSYLGIIWVMGFAHSLYGAIATRSPQFLMFSLYGFLHVGALLPVRIVALATLFASRWGTR